MACPAIPTGDAFLAGALAHIDCQARTIGSYGWAALADPASPVALALTGLLTIFVALFAFRLLLGEPLAGRDLVGDMLRVAIVLTLATSWPAWRVVGYDLVIDGPRQLAVVIGRGSGLPGGGGDLVARLGNADAGLAALNGYGSGRLGIAQGDWLQLGLARDTFLVGTLGSLALVRLAAGILLALAPLIAGLLLFDIARALFVGWARALAFTFAASLVLALVLGAELAALEPWLADALARRAADQQALAAPVEVLALTLGFAIAILGGLLVAARIAFFAAPARGVREGRSSALWSRSDATIVSPSRVALTVNGEPAPDRAVLIAQSITESARRAERIAGVAPSLAAPASGATGASASQGGASQSREPDSLGGSWRRGTRRVSAADARRDRAR